MKSLHRLVFAIALLAGPALQAQEWSPAQKEVWRAVQAYSAQAAASDLEGFMANFHPDYLGWHVGDALPSTKERARQFIAHDFKTTTTLLFDTQPVGIKIHGDIAIVHYHFTAITRGANGEEKIQKGRWTDILKKEGNRWLLIGDHGGAPMD